MNMKLKKKAQKCQIDIRKMDGHGTAIIVRGTKAMQERRTDEVNAADELANYRLQQITSDPIFATGVNRANINRESAMPVPKVRRLGKKNKESWKSPVLTPVEKVAHGRARMEMLQNATRSIKRKERKDEEDFGGWGCRHPKPKPITRGLDTKLLNDELLAAVLSPDKVKEKVVKEVKTAKKFMARKRQVRRAYGKVVSKRPSEPIWLPYGWISFFED
jgi:hypothetical protein